MKLIDRVKRHHLVESISVEDGGLVEGKVDYWVYLKPGWCHSGGEHSVHELTLTECLENLKLEVHPCDCDDCKPTKDF